MIAYRVPNIKNAGTNILAAELAHFSVSPGLWINTPRKEKIISKLNGER
jgi:hypothetical protein